MKFDKIKSAESVLFVTPLIFFILFFCLIPVFGTFINSCFQDVTFMPGRFVFLSNYRQLFFDSGFWNSLRFTLLFTVVSVPFELVIGFIFALLLNEPMICRGFIRVVVLIPWAIPTVISAKVWELIYNFNYGLANYIFKVAGISQEPINWLGTSLSAFFSLIVADAWKTAPFMAIIILAGLSSIPNSLYGQAKVDGANFSQRFFKITLPILKPILIVALLFRTIDALRVFDVIYVLTHGGPGGSTESVSMYGYKYFLSGDFGYGSSISVVLFLIAFVLSIFYIKMSGIHREY